LIPGESLLELEIVLPQERQEFFLKSDRRIAK
jgi:hypothetical protein